MKDQNNIVDNEPKNVKWNRALDLFIESVYKPDPELRNCAHNQNCFVDLMQIRDSILIYLETLRDNE